MVEGEERRKLFTDSYFILFMFLKLLYIIVEPVTMMINGVSCNRNQWEHLLTLTLSDCYSNERGPFPLQKNTVTHLIKVNLVCKLENRNSK